jgi:uncharacterized protein
LIFVDTNVFMYAVGRGHPLKEEARAFLRRVHGKESDLVASAEVLQELLHAYLPVARFDTLDAALTLAESSLGHIWPVELEDVRFARLLAERYPALKARDLLHLACCKRRGVGRIKTFDRALAAALE